MAATAYGNRRADKSIQKYKQTCIDAGCEIVALDPQVIAQLRDKGKVVYDMVRKDLGSEIVNQLLQAIDQARKNGK